MAQTVLVQNTTVTLNGVTIDGIEAITFGDGESDDIDTTVLSDTWKTFRPGLQDGGTVTLTLKSNPDDLGQQELQAQKNAQSISEMVITWPDEVTNNVFTFDAYVKSVPFDGQSNSVWMTTATLKVTGPIVRSDSTP